MNRRESILICIILMIMIVGSWIPSWQSDKCQDFTDQLEAEILQLRDERDYYKHWADTLQWTQDSVLVPEILSWYDHANRMKRIVSMPDTLEWDYANKLQYLNLRGWSPNE